jgi:hypothetical protein
VRIGHEFVERQHHAVVGQHLEEADLAVAEVGAMRRLDLAGALGIDQRLRALRPRQQDAAFLKGFADRGDAETQRGLVEPLAARIELGVAMISLSPLSTLPPGNTSAPELKSIS